MVLVPYKNVTRTSRILHANLPEASKTETDILLSTKFRDAGMVDK